jgi:hypothetical protein
MKPQAQQAAGVLEQDQLQKFALYPDLYIIGFIFYSIRDCSKKAVLSNLWFADFSLGGCRASRIK